MTLTFLQPPPELTRWQALTPEQKIAEVRHAVDVEGKTYGAAAARLGTSRLSIAGVVELSRRSADPIRSSSGMKNQNKGVAGGTRTVKTRKANKARAKAKTRPHQGFNKFVALPIPESAIDRSAVNGGAWLALPGSSPVPIADHHDGCRWPVGPDLPFCYCNEPVTGEKVYCAAHAAMAYREPPPRNDNGRRDSH